jgi:murein DD-endopeptidase MepM/ murein hydrolase activator NlpD
MLTLCFLLFSLGSSNFSSAVDSMPIDRELIELLSERNKLISRLSINTEEDANRAYQYWDSIPVRSPMKFSDMKRLTSDYGMRMHPILKVRSMHHGIDLSGNIGSDIISTANGRVTKVRISKHGYGNQVVIAHSDGYETRYAHMADVVVKVDDIVQAGDKIGTLGTTGMSTGPHLHYEVIKDGDTIDPLFFSYKNTTDRDFDSYKQLLTALDNTKKTLGNYNNTIEI